MAADYELLANEMSVAHSDKQYYCITIFLQPDGRPGWSAYSHWVEFKSRQPLAEIRCASLMKAELIHSELTSAGRNCLVVNSEAHLYIFFNIGGLALVEQQIAEAHLKDLVSDFECVSDAGVSFVGIEQADLSVGHRAPPRMLRMRVIKRDGFKCRICGRRPADYEDVELHVHHTRPWSEGGATHEQNLITPCHTCHGGLRPHYEHALFDLLDRVDPTDETSVLKYRQWVQSRFSSETPPD